MSLSDLPDFLQLPAMVRVHLTPMQILAVAGALRTLDDDMLTDEGVLPGLHETLQEAFEVLDAEAESLFGMDWPRLATTEERLLEDCEPDAEWDAEQDDYKPDAEWDDDSTCSVIIVTPRRPTLSGGAVVQLFPEMAE